jgi:hypothetical protein
MRAGTTEERLAALEAEVARLRATVEGERPGVIGKTRPDFLDTMVGIHANSPHFEEVVRRIETERERERAEARRLAELDEATG